MKYVLTTELTQGNTWRGIITDENGDDGYLCKINDEICEVGMYATNLPGTYFSSEDDVKEVFKAYVEWKLMLEAEANRLKRAARKYEYKDGEVVPYELPF